MNKTIITVVIILVVAFSAILSSTAGALPRALTLEEQAVLNLLDYDHAWRQLEYLSGLPEKLSGSPQEYAAQDYVYQQFQQMGIDDVARETFNSQWWVHEGTSLKIISPREEGIPATTFGGSHSVWGKEDGKPYYFGNRNGGRTLVAPLINVGFGTAAEFGAIGNVAGKIVLVRRDDDVTLWPNVVLEEAAARGAAAVIFYGYYGTYPHPDSIIGDPTLPDDAMKDSVLERIAGMVNEEVNVDFAVYGEVITYSGGEEPLPPTGLKFK